MIRAGELLAGILPTNADPEAPRKRGPGGLPLMLRTPDGRTGRVLEANATAARLQFETWSEPRGRYRTLGAVAEWWPIRRLAPVVRS